MSSVLCNSGPLGLDQLSRAVNSFLGSMVDIVYQWGGDVMYFAGDALICIFKENPLSSQDCCLNAMGCGLLLKDCLISGLSCHVGIAYSDMCVAIMGGFDDKWFCVPSGECFDDMNSCLEDAGRSEVVISHLMFPLLSEKIDFVSMNSGNYNLKSTNNFKRRPNELKSNRVTNQSTARCVSLSKFIPLPLLIAVVHNSVANLNELRNVCTIFLRLDSYSSVFNKDLLSIQPIFLKLQEIIHLKGGFIRQFLIDDKGCVLIIMWGTPDSTFPNNCFRAVKCAVSLRSTINDMNHSSSIGITTGIVYCGIIGPTYRQDYMAIGSSVNLAARLMGTAKGHIIIDQNTLDNVSTDIIDCFREHEKVRVKGFDKLVQCYRVCESVAMFDAINEVNENLDINKEENAVVSEEMLRVFTNTCAAISNHQESNASNHKTDFLLVRGEPGTGRTTFCRHMKTRIIEQGGRFVFISVKSIENGMYSVFRSIFMFMVQSVNFTCIKKQQEVISSLMHSCFPTEKDNATQKRRFQLIQQVLNLSWDFEKIDFSFLAAASTEATLDCADSVTSSGKHIHTENSVDATFVIILKHIMIDKSYSVIIIDDAHAMDIESWYQLAKLRIQRCA